ncbi:MULTISPECIES: Holliday junction resolvase RuvX [Salimicrobium]|uniref:Putative pre-16S rRNA nuclease n=2 Tax=Salimicrobium TaxID=351195 RepID=A0ABY1KN06_9BACI|nr:MULTISPECIES: Holliday junction resolvase RuvX [Salimicrobium]SDX66776.1 putative holliday junction resolvase [Salimicrobium album]SIS51592.1 putative holliday junction resolvase [Salimicrobium salexigens]
MKKLGLDVGEKTIGVAVSDALGMTAQGIKTIHWDEDDYSTARQALTPIIEREMITEAVVGYPKNMNGSIGPRAEQSERFANWLEKNFEIPVHLWDERLTTMAAERVLLEADVSRKKRKKVVDKMAAVMILQGYLDAPK